MTTAAAAPSKRWLYGMAPDLLIGCGLWYALAFAVLAVAGTWVRTAGMQTLIPFLLLAFSSPHYGATLLRVYEQREERQSYAVFTIFATAILATLYVVGVHSAAVGSIVLTVYLTWSPWHYTGQNYGIGVMFLRRRGVDLEGNAKRLVYASFILSYVMVFLALHGGARADDYIPVAYDPVGYHFLPLGLPYTSLTLPAVGLAYVAVGPVAQADYYRGLATELAGSTELTTPVAPAGSGGSDGTWDSMVRGYKLHYITSSSG